MVFLSCHILSGQTPHSNFQTCNKRVLNSVFAYVCFHLHGIKINQWLPFIFLGLVFAIVSTKSTFRSEVH